MNIEVESAGIASTWQDYWEITKPRVVALVVLTSRPALFAKSVRALWAGCHEEYGSAKKDLLVDRWGLRRYVGAAPRARTLAHNFVEQMAEVGLPHKATFRRDLRERVARYRQELLSTLDSRSNDILVRRATKILFEDAL